MSGDRQAHTDHLYLLLAELGRCVGGPRRLRDCAGRDGWPRHGVYFFYEDGEARANGSDRVVRVGTHALLATSGTTLWSRLRQHRGRVGGRNPGGGNHRASIFRGHVGTALIRRGSWPDGLLDAWLNRDRQPKWAPLEAQVELAVSRHIGAMPFLWLDAPDRPDGSSDRGYLERNTIALLSCLTGGLDHPSPGWLGHDASNPNIPKSGLWNSNHVADTYGPAFLQILADAAKRVP